MEYFLLILGLIGFVIVVGGIMYRRAEEDRLFLLIRKENVAIGFQEGWKLNTGEELESYLKHRTVLVVFLRHFGCTFCRETLADLNAREAYFKEKGIDLLLVHMVSYPEAQPYLEKFGLSGVPHLSDPKAQLYEVFHLRKGKFNQLFGLRSWIEGFRAGIIRGFGVGTKQVGDGFRMPGTFLIRKGRMIKSFIHSYASDRPDYENLCEIPSPPEHGKRTERMPEGMPEA